MLSGITSRSNSLTIFVKLVINNNNWWWGSSNGERDWGMSSKEALGKLRSSSSFDVSWVQSLVKESPNEVKEKEILC